MKELLSHLTPFFPLVYAVLVFITGLTLARWVPRLVLHGMQKKGVDPTLFGFVKNLLKIVILIFTIISAAGLLGLPVTSFITALGAAGVAVGLALKDYLSNFASGIVLIVLKPFHVGDFIEVDDITGTVKSIELMYTHLTTPDNKEAILPNTKLTNDKVVNFSANELRRLDLLFSIGYEEDIAHAKDILFAVALQNPMALKDPEPIIGVDAQADSSIRLSLWVWCKGSDYIPLKHALNETVRNVFAKEGICIPYPQVDVHIER